MEVPPPPPPGVPPRRENAGLGRSELERESAGLTGIDCRTRLAGTLALRSAWLQLAKLAVGGDERVEIK